MYKTAGSWGIESVKPNSVESFSGFFFFVFLSLAVVAFGSSTH